MSVAVDRDQAFLEEIGRIADEVAAPNADAVDREARFPAESIAARVVPRDRRRLP
jgi:acyl-CoA dehydrogenase